MAWSDYINAYPDLREAFKNSTLAPDVWGQKHWSEFGKKEGRTLPIQRLDIPNKQTSHDRGATWVDDPNTHFTFGGNSYYVTPGTSINDMSNWRTDTMAGWHRSRPEQSPSHGFSPFPSISAPRSEQKPIVDLPTLTEDVQRRSFSGIDWQASPVMKNIEKTLSNYVRRLPKLAEDFNETLQNQYANFMRNIAPTAFQDTLNNLSSRRMINSSVARDAMSDTMSDITEQVGNKAYESYLQGLLAQMGIPTQLGQLASLGQVSRYTDPTFPYEFLLRLVS